MTDRPEEQGTNDNTLSPLPGEPGIPSVAERPRSPMAKKGLLAVGLLILSLVPGAALQGQGSDKRRKPRQAPAPAVKQPRSIPTTRSRRRRETCRTTSATCRAFWTP